MKKRLFVMAMICIVLIGFNTRVPQAAEVDILINKLVEKRIITQDEATQLMDEMRKEGRMRRSRRSLPRPQRKRQNIISRSCPHGLKT
jgi:polyhydroxyalkanoate synthesis regulator phasin